MTKKELTEWWKLYLQKHNGYHFSKHDWAEFIRLNHLVMEAVHKIHNENMLDK